MLRGHTYNTFKARSLSMHCREACNSEIKCQSYNYVFFQDICELNNRTKEARPEDFVNDRDRYYMKKAPNRVPLGFIPELPADSCAEIKASEGGQAVSGDYWMDSTRSGNSILARCDMKTGATDYCINHQCQNNATCINSHMNYTCSCNSSGWTGNYCEKDVNECNDGLHGCHSNATCNNTKGSYNCTCKPGFHGNGKNICEVLFQCPPSWIAFEESCYRLFSDKKDWNDAKAFCDASGTQLVKIKSADENDFVNQEFLPDGASYWIGLTDAVTEGDWKWSDGSKLAWYTNWVTGEPNNYNNQDCVAIAKGDFDDKYFDGEWHDAECTKTREYIYQFVSAKVLFQCQPSWTAFEGSCYILFTDKKDWNNAKAFCNANGAQLVKIESADENDFVNQEFLPDSYWIGLTDAEIEGDWKWSDGSILTAYTNWMSEEPNNYNNQDCVAIANDGEWHDAECTKVREYICEM
ncbi:hypothetical protein ACROYT_G027318 [Oculina patagonica]